MLALALLVQFARAEGLYARAGFAYQDARTYSGSTTSLGLGVAKGRDYRLGVNADLLERTYGGEVRVTDDQFGLGGAVATGETTYVEALATTAASANIYARWGASATPHYVFSGNDFGLGVRYAEYRAGRAGGLTPSYLRYLPGGFAAGAGAFVVRTDRDIVAYQTQVIYNPGGAHAARVTGAAGQTLEDAGLVARFNSLGLEYTYTCVAGFSLGVTYVDYWSQVRREHAYGVRLGWR